VRGHVTLATQETPQPNLLAALTSPEATSSGRSASVDRQGNFDIKSVVPGLYILSVSVIRSSKPPYSTQIALTVGSAGVDGLTVNVPPPVELNGTVRAEGNDPIAFRNVRIAFTASGAVGAGNRSFAVSANESGAFHVENVNPDRYIVSSAGVPGGRYLKAVRAGGVDALANGLDLSGGSPGVIEIVLGAKAGILTGLVQAEKSGQPFSGATVVLAPQEKERREQSLYYKTTLSGAEGRFTFSGVPPGAYRLFAWEWNGDDFNYLDPDSAKPFESRGQAVAIREGDYLELQLTAIPAGAH
jgi:hypothetical protein